ncbi:beta-lactamase family protein [Shewanella cyperi]|uniref:Beta-lactamase family protein n=1 Tax=Shewanella cyperi TaxID=2814292 RepID=A0A974XL33_9GAMM|nr:serine hydrolase domain-containing protein [Shewanella cyperi]QSX29218.1 beta-lactamase family protein [Shewanella cyperi]
MALVLLFATKVACADTAQQLDALVKQDGRDFSGVILVRQGNSELALRTYGEGINADSLFILGSLSKQVFATAALKAVDLKLFTLSDSVNSALPEALQSTNPVSMTQLLSHTSGIARSGNKISGSKANGFEYSNANYQIAAHWLANLQGQSTVATLQSLFQTNQLDLLADTGTVQEIKARHPRLALGRLQKDGQWLPIPADFSSTDVSLASGTLIGSARGFADFQQKLHTGALLSDASYRDMVTPRATRPHSWGELGYGLGVQIGQDAREISHSGYVPGYMTTAVYYPDSQLQLVVLENSAWDLKDPQWTFALHDALHQWVLNLAPKGPLEK